MFKSNVGSVDRVIRIVIGLGILSLFFLYPDASGRYYSLLGAIPLLTGAIGTCPLYSLIGLSTCPVNRA
jgi:hypothetical protein